MSDCAGCGRPFVSGEAIYEIARYLYYCTFCCLPGVADDFPVVVEQSLVLTGNGTDD